ncbi:LppU/SCO3897 family protein [Nocardia arthritidis]|uniref:Uncharacterized protein n=1 Tax=Nocardia arthritidis TaxID=228602 RepID=A0A6G9Y7W7_9NOCA|nr:hypothetical protein [Nocardia arthritidis]QIS09312.1 hypothetical protein F5544_07010 [Nocardia arthritidis]
MTTPPNYPNSGQPQPGWGQQPGYPPATPGYGPPQPESGAQLGNPGGYPPAPGQQAPAGGYPQGGYPPPPSGGYQQGGFPPPNQPGQQGFPGQQPGVPGVPPVPYSPTPPQSGGKSALKIVIALVVLVVVGGGLFGASRLLRSDPQKINVGQCAKLSGTTYKPEFATKDCGDAEANYVVAQRIDKSDADCATKDYASYYETGKGNHYTLCLRLNVKQGDCVKTSTLGASTKVACTSSADFKIGRIVTGQATPSACGSDYTERETIVYPKPDPMTLCLVEPK